MVLVSIQDCSHLPPSAFIFVQEVAVPSQAHSLQMFNEKLCVGYQSGFSLFHLYMDGKPQSKTACLLQTFWKLMATDVFVYSHSRTSQSWYTLRI